MYSLLRVSLKKFGASGIALATVTALTLAGCGGSDGPAAASSVTGQFVDAPVAGLGYKCGTSTTLGTTDATGNYTCKTGESVGFYVGDILLGTVASAQAIVTPLDLVGPGAQPTDAAVSNIVRFLLSISTTDAAGNLVIDSTAVANAKGKTVDFKTIASAALDTMITTVKPGATPVTTLAAENHMRDSIYKLFAKSYSGTYSGSLSGTWNLSISATDGSVTGTYTDSVNGPGPIAGTMSTVMKVSSTYDFSGTAGSATWTGTLNVNTGVFSGTWDSGTFTGKVAASTPVTPGTGGTAGYPTTASYVGKLSDGSACTVNVAADHSVTVSAASWAYPSSIVTTLDGFYFDNTNGEIAPAVFYTGTTRFFESNAGNFAAASTSAPAFNTGLSFDATSGKLIMAFGSATTDTGFTPAAGANFNFVCAGEAFPASATIGTSQYNQAAPSRFKATTLVGGPYTAPTASNQACTFSVDATGNASINWAGFTTTSGKLDLPYTWLTTDADQSATQAKYDIYINKTTGSIVGSNFGGTVVLNTGDSAVSDWFSVTISQSSGNKQAVVQANGYASDPKSVTCSTANDPAGKWAQVAAYAGTWTGSKDINFHFGTNASCQLVVAADGAMTYTDTAGVATTIDSTSWTVTPPNTGAYFDFAKNGTSVTFSMDFTGTSVSGTQPQAFFWKTGASYEYCNAMSKL